MMMMMMMWQVTLMLTKSSLLLPQHSAQSGKLEQLPALVEEIVGLSMLRKNLFRCLSLESQMYSGLGGIPGSLAHSETMTMIIMTTMVIVMIVTMLTIVIVIFYLSFPVGC